MKYVFLKFKKKKKKLIMNKYLFVLIALSTIKSQTSAEVASDLSEVDFDATNIVEETRDYNVNFDHLCPNVPTKGALDCLKNFKLSQHVSQIINTKDDPTIVVDHLSELVKCTTSKLPSTEITLNIYCYLEGVKEDIFNTNNLSVTDENAKIEIIKILREAKRNSVRRDIKDFFKSVIDKINTGDGSILDLVGEVDEAKMEALVSAREDQDVILDSRPNVRAE